MFLGKDVAQALGYTNTRKALQDHVDKEDKGDGVTIRDSIGRIQKAVLINESGLYSLILSSKLPQAKAFKRIRIHAGHTAADTAGCILVGGNQIVGQLLESRKWLYELKQKIVAAKARGEAVWITIK